MKTFRNLFLLFSICTSCSCSVFSQQCSDDSLKTFPTGEILYSDQGFANGGLTPCITNGTYSELVIPFGTYHERGRRMILPDSTEAIVSDIYAIHIDNVLSLPSGLCWTVRPASGVIHDGESGMLIIKGTASLPAGTLSPVSVKLSIDTKGKNAYTYTDLDIWNYKPFLGQVVIRSMGASGICPEPNF